MQNHLNKKIHLGEKDKSHSYPDHFPNKLQKFLGFARYSPDCFCNMFLLGVHTYEKSPN